MKTEKSNNLYNKQLKPFSQQLRNRGTKAEACLWKYVLRAGQIKGYEFRRQRPISGFIADFLCFKLNLVVEVDGLSHLWDETAIRDERKEQVLSDAGFTVLRFSDQEVLRDIHTVRQQIEWWIEAWEDAHKDTAAPDNPPIS